MDKEKPVKQSRRKIWVPACPDCNDACTDEGDSPESVEKLVFEIPGVEKKNIHLDVVKDRVRMIAHRDDNIDYISEYLFSCPANLEDSPNASYDNGVLKLEVPVECPNPYKEAYRVEIK